MSNYKDTVKEPEDDNFSLDDILGDKDYDEIKVHPNQIKFNI